MKTADIVALPLQLGPALRHRRVFHPLGVLAAGRIERIAPADVGLPVESADILGRVSKTIGMPGGLPDLIGLARDVLIVSAGSGLLTRCALPPTVSWTGTTLSTLMPFRREDGWWWVEAAMITPMGSGLSLDAVREQILNSGIVFDVQQAHVTGFFEPLAELTLTTVIPTDEDHDVSLDPTRNKTPGVGLVPNGLPRCGNVPIYGAAAAATLPMPPTPDRRVGRCVVGIHLASLMPPHDKTQFVNTPVCQRLRLPRKGSEPKLMARA